MRLIQFETAQGQRHVGVIEGDEIHVVLGTETTRELALEAIRKGHGLVAEVPPVAPRQVLSVIARHWSKAAYSRRWTMQIPPTA
jgi:hypothetical protein